jgi:hypothetical protein
VVACLDGHDVLDEISEQDLEHFKEVHEILAFAGLAGREFFGPSDYVNLGNFVPVIQRFRDASSGVMLRSRRRDGHTENLSFGEWHKEFIPEHVCTHDTAIVDESLVQALVTANGVDGLERYLLSIPLFNRANTDDEVMATRIEAVLMISAFERLLESPPRQQDLVDRFVEGLAVDYPGDRAAYPRIPANRFPRIASVRGAWMADFFTLRGSLAHGHSLDAYPSVWNLHEHLLLGSAVFPLLVKELLARDGIYTLTGEDLTRIEAFEHLAGHENLFSQNAEGNWPWREIIGEIMMIRALR